MRKDEIDSIRRYLWVFLYQFLLKGLIYILALLPFAYSLTLNTNSNILHAFLISISLFATIIFLAIIIGLTLFFLPKVKPGAYIRDSKLYYSWLRRNIVAEIVLTSSFINNFINRVTPINSIFYFLAGLKYPTKVILAPDVKLLDPERCEFGKYIFIGYGTVISGHTIKGKKLMLANTIIKDKVTIGSFCRIAIGTTIDKNTLIDYGVEVGSFCKIGSNVTIFAGSRIDDFVTIGDNSVIGKGCIIGRKSIVGDGVFIGSFTSMLSRGVLKNNVRIPEFSVVKKG